MKLLDSIEEDVKKTLFQNSDEIIIVGVERPTLLDSIKRVLLCSLLPFDYMAEISISPDSLGPILSLVLASITEFFSFFIILQQMNLGLAKGKMPYPAPLPNLFINKTAILVIPKGINITVVRYVEPSDRLIEAFYAQALISTLIVWLAYSIMIYLFSKLFGIIGGGPSPILGGYMLSLKLYESLTKSIIYYSIISNREILVILPRETHIFILQGYLTTMLLQIGGIVLRAHMVFFTIWSIVLFVATFYSGRGLSIKKSLLVGVLSYILASMFSSMLTRLSTFILAGVRL